MNFEQLKEALLSRLPVIFHDWSLGDIEYAFVSAIICRTDPDGKVFIQAELTDKLGLSTTIADPERVVFKEV